MAQIKFFVEGIPVPQGSFRHIGGGRVIAANPKLNAWRELIAIEGRKHAKTPIDAPTVVELVFTLPKPKTVTREFPTARIGDLDKLARAVLDAVSLPKYVQLIKDDSMVIDLVASKRYGNPTGVKITIVTK